MGQRNSQFRIFPRGIWVILQYAGVSVLLSLALDIVTDEPKLALTNWTGLGVAVISLCVLLLAYIWIYRKQQIGVRLLDEDLANVKPSRFMIVILSPPGAFEVALTGLNLVLTHTSPIGKSVTFMRRDLELAIDAVEMEFSKQCVYWKWQQLLRGLAANQSKLERVILIGSDGKDGSHRCIQDAKTVINFFLPDVVVGPDVPAVNFHRFSSLFASLSKVIEEVCNSPGIRHHDIVIDVTGGVVTASIAGAVLTLNKDITFQYVETSRQNPGDRLKVWRFDAESEREMP